MIPWVHDSQRLIEALNNLGYNPIYTFLEVPTTEQNGNCFRVDMHRIVLLVLHMKHATVAYEACHCLLWDLQWDSVLTLGHPIFVVYHAACLQGSYAVCCQLFKCRSRVLFMNPQVFWCQVFCLTIKGFLLNKIRLCKNVFTKQFFQDNQCYNLLVIVYITTKQSKRLCIMKSFCLSFFWRH